MGIKGMPKIGQVAINIDGKQTEFVIQIFPDYLFITCTQIGKIGHMIQLQWPPKNFLTKKRRPMTLTILGGEDPLSDFIGRQLLMKSKDSKNRPIIFASGFPRKENPDIA